MSCRDSGSFRDGVLMLGRDSTSAVLVGARSRAGLATRPLYVGRNGRSGPEGTRGSLPDRLTGGAPDAGS